MKTQISPLLRTNPAAPNKKKSGPTSGFTIIEILLVITLLGLLATSVVPRITNFFQIGLSSSVRRYGALVKYAFDQAVLTGRTHRIVLDLDSQEWTVEQAQGEGTFVEGIRATRDSDVKRSEELIKSTSSYKRLKNSLLDKMPRGVEIVSAESTRFKKIEYQPDSPDPSGKFYLYAFPSGFIDEGTVVLSEIGRGEVNQFKIQTKSLTGRVKIEASAKNRGEVKPGP